MSQFGFRTSPNNQSSSASTSLNRNTSSPPSSATLPSASVMAVTSSAPLNTTSAGGSNSPPSAASQRCCDTGRPLFTDPITGQSVCSCQYELLGYQRLAAGAAGVPGLPALSMYSSPYPEGMAAYFPALGADQPPFYAASAAGLDLKENLAAGAAAGWPYPSVYHPYDTAFAGYPFNGYGMDLNGARRKNATRETTSTLKAWLNEHKKNPYPTKGEKIMLAIITKMTLTQVSTWFANARRRLKKENKMTWEPRNRVEDEDNNNDDDDRKSTDGKDLLDSGTASSEDGDRVPISRLGPDTASEWSESRPDSGPDSPPPDCYERPPHPAFLPVRNTGLPLQSSAPLPVKPRIWSLADMANKGSDVGSGGGGGGGGGGSNPTPPPPSTLAHNLYQGSASSRLLPRLPPPSLHTSPYSRPPPDFYRSLYGGVPGASVGAGPPDQSFLETYSRTLAAHQAKAAAAAAVAAAATAQAGGHFGGGGSMPSTPREEYLKRLSPASTSSMSSGSETPHKPVALNKA